MSDILRPRGLQYTRLPCSSLSPRVCSNSCPMSQWCHPTVSSSVALFLCPWSFPIFLGLFQRVGFSVSRLFVSGDQTIRASASASVLPMNIQSWFPLGLISLQSKGLSRVFFSITIWKHQFFSTQPSLWFNSHIHTWLLEKPWLYVGSLFFYSLKHTHILLLAWNISYFVQEPFQGKKS